jgi:hypothetical protein
VSQLKATGERVLTVMDRCGRYAQPLPLETWQDETRLNYGVGAENALKTSHKKLERLRREFGPQVFIEATRERVIEEPEVEVDWTYDATLSPSFGAKVGLGFGREVLGEEWPDSDAAQYLRNVFFDSTAMVPRPYAPLAPIAEPLLGSPLANYIVRPDHVVTAMGTAHAAALGIFLFGDQRYLVPLGGEITDDELATWIFNPYAGSAERLSWTAYAEGTAIRLVEQHEGKEG